MGAPVSAVQRPSLPPQTLPSPSSCPRPPPHFTSVASWKVVPFVFPYLPFSSIISSSQLSLSLPLVSLSSLIPPHLTSSLPLPPSSSLPPSHPFYSAVKASGLVLPQIKTLSLSLSLFHSLSLSLSFSPSLSFSLPLSLSLSPGERQLEIVAVRGFSARPVVFSSHAMDGIEDGFLT